MSLLSNSDGESLNSDHSVIPHHAEDSQYQFVNSGVEVDIKYELPSQPAVQILDVDGLELEGGDVGFHDVDVDSQMAPLEFIGIGPTPELKDPLDLQELLPEKSNPEVRTTVNVTKSVSTPTPILIRHPPKKLKKISTAICTKCNTGFPSPFLFEQHMIQIHQDERPYPCKFCGKPFAQRQELKIHETIHDPNRFKGEPKFACDICGKRYHIKGSMEGHRKIVHLGYKKPSRKSSAPIKEHHSTSGVKNPNPYRKPKEIHPCPHCDLTFEMKCLLQKHMTCHTKERPFSCPICQQPFPKQTQVKTHIRTVHQSATPSGMRHPRPKWQAKLPCPCKICGKVFKVPSQLANHILLHTGEKPHACPTCGETFRMKQILTHHIKRNHIQDQLKTNPLKLYKCRICGKEDFTLFTDLNRHRIQFHKHIPFESEAEKPFGCGICGKPYYLREGALICALLGHDPTSLSEAMFKHKCTECPSDHFGFHNLTFLRRHWEVEHPDKQLPVQFRVGMYSENLKVDELPSCSIDKVKRDYILKNGPQVKSEFPLYTEFDLLPIPKEERFYRKGEHEIVYSRKFKCTICGLKTASQENLKRHEEQAGHRRSNRSVSARGKNKGLVKKGEYTCTICDLKVARASNLKRHMIIVHDPNRTTLKKKVIKAGFSGIRRRVGRPRKLEGGNGRGMAIIDIDVETDHGVIVKSEPMEINEDGESDGGTLIGDYEDEVEIPRWSSMFKCRFCERRFPKIQPLRMHELRKHVKPWSTSKNKNCVEKAVAGQIRIPVELEQTRSPPGSCHGEDNFGEGVVNVVNICDKAGIKAILNFQSVQVQLTRLVDMVDGDFKEKHVEPENELDHDLADDIDAGGDGDNKEENEVPAKTWRGVLGNKEFKIVLHRVDKQ